MRKFLQLIAVTVCVSVASCCSVTCFSHGVRSRFLSESTAGHLWLGSHEVHEHIIFGNLHITVFHGVSSWAERVQFRCRAPSRARGANFGVISAGAAATPGPFQAGGTAARQASAPRIPPRRPRRPARARAPARPCATASATRRPSRADGRAARTGFPPSPRAAGALAVVSEASAARPTPGRCRARAAAARAPSSGLAAAPRRRGAAA